MGLLPRRAGRRRTVTRGRHEKRNSTVTATNHASEHSHRRRQWKDIVTSLRRTQPTSLLSTNQIIPEESSATTDLWTACKTGNAVVVRQIIQTNPELIHLEQQGRSPLYYACHGGHYKVAELLLRAGATDDSFKTCYQSSLNQRIRQLLLQYQAVDCVLELQQKASSMNLECPATPACSSSSSSSIGCCDYADDENNSSNDMYLHLFDSIEATCSHSEENNASTTNTGSNKSVTKNEANFGFSAEIETAAPSSLTPPSSTADDDPTILCNDSLLTERVQNHSKPLIRHRSNIEKRTPMQQTSPSYMCFRETSLIDSDAMEEEMWNNSEIESATYAEEDCAELFSSTQLSATEPSSSPALTMGATLTIETSDRKIEVQETVINSQHESNTKSSTLKERLLQQVSGRRKKGNLTRKYNDPENYIIKAKENSKSSVEAPVLPPIQSHRNIVGRRRALKRVQENVDDECQNNYNTIIETSVDGESEVVLRSSSGTNVNRNDDSSPIINQELVDNVTPMTEELEPSIQKEEIDTSELSSFPNEEATLDKDSRTHDVSGVATLVELSLAQTTANSAFRLSQQPSEYSTNTGTSSLWSYNTYTSSYEIKKVLIPIITVPVSFEDEMKYGNTISSSVPQDDNSVIIESPVTATSNAETHGTIPLHRTVNRSPLGIQTMEKDVKPATKNFVESTMNLFGCLPENADETLTLHSMSFDKPLDQHTSKESESSDMNPNMSKKSNINVDRNLTSRVNKLIHETSVLHTPNLLTHDTSSEHSSQHIIPKIVASSSPRSSMSTSIHSDEINTSNDDNDFNHDADDIVDHEGDTTSQSQSADDSLEEQCTDHSHDDHSNYSSFSSDSFYDDDDDTDVDSFSDSDRLDQKMMAADEISAPDDVTAIFCR